MFKRIMLLTLLISTLTFSLGKVEGKETIVELENGKVLGWVFISSNNDKMSQKAPYYKDRWYQGRGTLELVNGNDIMSKIYKIDSRSKNKASHLYSDLDLQKNLVEVKHELLKKIWSEDRLDHLLTVEQKYDISEIITGMILLDKDTASNYYEDEYNVQEKVLAQIIDLPNNKDILYSDRLPKRSSRDRKIVLIHELVHKITDYIYPDTKEHHGEEYRSIGKTLGYPAYFFKGTI